MAPIAALWMWGYSGCLAQNLTLDLASGTGRPGFRVILNLTLENRGGVAPSSIQWTFGYSRVDFTAFAVSVGPAAGNKVISCSQSPGVAKCILWGRNSSAISNGVVADLSLTISGAAKDTSTNIQVYGGQAADGDGRSLPMTTGGGTVTIVQPHLQGVVGELKLLEPSQRVASVLLREGPYAGAHFPPRARSFPAAPNAGVVDSTLESTAHIPRKGATESAGLAVRFNHSSPRAPLSVFRKALAPVAPRSPRGHPFQLVPRLLGELGVADEPCLVHRV